MESVKPQTIAIDHDNYHAEHVGVTKTGNQFFLTTPFEPAINGKEGCEYIALFEFDREGNLANYVIDTLGPRGTYSEEAREKKYLSRLKVLGEVEYCRIVVKPFSVQEGGVSFGLIPREPEDEEDVWAVELLPGNYMAFFEPWDSGEYDT
ncbi:MAG: hypothetical protein AB2697_10545 [Candidatus Thiodiazotropha endolucinida]